MMVSPMWIAAIALGAFTGHVLHEATHYLVAYAFDRDPRYSLQSSEVSFIELSEPSRQDRVATAVILLAPPVVALAALTVSVISAWLPAPADPVSAVFVAFYGFHGIHRHDIPVAIEELQLLVAQ